MTNCNHDLRSSECTIRFLRRRNMVEEGMKYGVCPICGRSFVINEVQNTCVEAGCAADAAKEDDAS